DAHAGLPEPRRFDPRARGETQRRLGRHTPAHTGGTGRAVSVFVDTNILVRHLTGAPPDLAARATRFLTQEHDLLITDLVVAETIYVLESFYRAPRRQIAEATRSLSSFPSILVVDPALLLRSIEV